MAAAPKTQRHDWSYLPPELSELVLARLPDVAALERARMVCRQWRATIASPSFRQLQALLHPRRPSRLLLYTHDASVAAASPPIRSRCKDHSTTIPSSSSSSSKEDKDSVIMQVSWRQLRPPLPMACIVREWVGGQGLVCLRSTAPDLQSHTYLVGDPLIASSWRALPDPPLPSHTVSIPKLWSIVAHPPSLPRTSTEPLVPDRQFSVLLLHRTSASSSTLHIFRSATNTWTAQIVPQGLVGAAVDWTTFSTSAASIGRHVYCIHGQRPAIVKFDVAVATWELLEGAGLPSDLALMGGADHHLRPSYGDRLLDAPPKLVQGPNGRMLMMGAAISSASAPSSSSSVHVWEMERQHGWRIIARAPSRMWGELLDEAKESRKCVLLPVRFAGEGEVMVVMACGSSRAIAFNVVDETWQWMHIPSMANCDLSLCCELPTADDQ